MASMARSSIDVIWKYSYKGSEHICKQAKKVITFMFQSWTRGFLCLLLLGSLPFLAPVILVTMMVGGVFVVPLLCAITAYYVLFRRFSLPITMKWFSSPKPPLLMEDLDIHTEEYKNLGASTGTFNLDYEGTCEETLDSDYEFEIVEEDPASEAVAAIAEPIVTMEAEAPPAESELFVHGSTPNVQEKEVLPLAVSETLQEDEQTERVEVENEAKVDPGLESAEAFMKQHTLPVRTEQEDLASSVGVVLSTAGTIAAQDVASNESVTALEEVHPEKIEIPEGPVLNEKIEVLTEETKGSDIDASISEPDVSMEVETKSETSIVLEKDVELPLKMSAPEVLKDIEAVAVPTIESEVQLMDEQPFSVTSAPKELLSSVEDVLATSLLARVQEFVTPFEESDMEKIEEPEALMLQVKEVNASVQEATSSENDALIAKSKVIMEEDDRHAEDLVVLEKEVLPSTIPDSELEAKEAQEVGREKPAEGDPGVEFAVQSMLVESELVGLASSAEDVPAITEIAPVHDIVPAEVAIAVEECEKFNMIAAYVMEEELKAPVQDSGAPENDALNTEPDVTDVESKFESSSDVLVSIVGKADTPEIQEEAVGASLLEFEVSSLEQQSSSVEDGYLELASPVVSVPTIADTGTMKDTVVSEVVFSVEEFDVKGVDTGGVVVTEVKDVKGGPMEALPEQVEKPETPVMEEEVKSVAEPSSIKMELFKEAEAALAAPEVFVERNVLELQDNTEISSALPEPLLEEKEAPVVTTKTVTETDTDTYMKQKNSRVDSKPVVLSSPFARVPTIAEAAVDEVAPTETFDLIEDSYVGKVEVPDVLIVEEEVDAPAEETGSSSTQSLLESDLTKEGSVGPAAPTVFVEKVPVVQEKDDDLLSIVIGPMSEGKGSLGVMEKTEAVDISALDLNRPGFELVKNFSAIVESSFEQENSLGEVDAAAERSKFKEGEMMECQHQTMFSAPGMSWSKGLQEDEACSIERDIQVGEDVIDNNIFTDVETIVDLLRCDLDEQGHEQDNRQSGLLLSQELAEENPFVSKNALDFSDESCVVAVNQKDTEDKGYCSVLHVSDHEKEIEEQLVSTADQLTEPHKSDEELEESEEIRGCIAELDAEKLLPADEPKARLKGSELREERYCNARTTSEDSTASSERVDLSSADGTEEKKDEDHLANYLKSQGEEKDLEEINVDYCKLVEVQPSVGHPVLVAGQSNLEPNEPRAWTTEFHSSSEDLVDPGESDLSIDNVVVAETKGQCVDQTTMPNVEQKLFTESKTANEGLFQALSPTQFSLSDEKFEALEHRLPSKQAVEHITETNVIEEELYGDETAHEVLARSESKQEKNEAEPCLSILEVVKTLDPMTEEVLIVEPYVMKESDVELGLPKTINKEVQFVEEKEVELPSPTAAGEVYSQAHEKAGALSLESGLPNLKQQLFSKDFDTIKLGSPVPDISNMAEAAVVQSASTTRAQKQDVPIADDVASTLEQPLFGSKMIKVVDADQHAASIDVAAEEGPLTQEKKTPIAVEDFEVAPALKGKATDAEGHSKLVEEPVHVKGTKANMVEVSETLSVEEQGTKSRVIPSRELKYEEVPDEGGEAPQSEALIFDGVAPTEAEDVPAVLEKAGFPLVELKLPTEGKEMITSEETSAPHELEHTELSSRDKSQIVQEAQEKSAHAERTEPVDEGIEVAENEDEAVECREQDFSTLRPLNVAHDREFSHDGKFQESVVFTSAARAERRQSFENEEVEFGASLSPHRRRGFEATDILFRSHLGRGHPTHRHSAPDCLGTHNWARDLSSSAHQEKHPIPKKMKYKRWSASSEAGDGKISDEPGRSYSASVADSDEPYMGDFDGLSKSWKERDKPSLHSSMDSPFAASSAEIVGRIREEIIIIQKIIGQEIPPQCSLWEEVEILTKIVGMELPDMGDVSDLTKARQGLDLLKVVVGITCT